MDSTAISAVPGEAEGRILRMRSPDINPESSAIVKRTWNLVLPVKFRGDDIQTAKDRYNIREQVIFDHMREYLKVNE